MSILSQAALCGPYGEVVLVNPLQHSPDLVVQTGCLLDQIDNARTTDLRFYFAFVKARQPVNHRETLIADLRSHVQACLATDGIPLPSSKRDQLLQVYFSRKFAHQYADWPVTLQVF